MQREGVQSHCASPDSREIGVKESRASLSGNDTGFSDFVSHIPEQGPGSLHF